MGNGDIGRIRQCAKNVEKLACGDRCRRIFFIRTDFGMRDDLDFSVCRQERNRFTFFPDQNVGQNRQGMSAFHDTANDLQWAKKIVSAGFYQLHVLILENLIVLYPKIFQL